MTYLAKVADVHVHGEDKRKYGSTTGHHSVHDKVHWIVIVILLAIAQVIVIVIAMEKSDFHGQKMLTEECWMNYKLGRTKMKNNVDCLKSVCVITRI